MDIVKVTDGKRRRRLMGLDGRIRHLETLAGVSESIDKKVARIVAEKLPALVAQEIGSRVEEAVRKAAEAMFPDKAGTLS